jgi:hypothetical protein
LDKAALKRARIAGDTGAAAPDRRDHAVFHGVDFTKSPRIAAKARWHAKEEFGLAREARGSEKLAYKMIAERDNEKVNAQRESRLLIVAKARVFSSEGWKVVVTDGEGKSYAPEEFEKLLAA